MKNLNELTIGIVGGAGPMASVLLNQYIVESCQYNYACKEDRDFPSILSYSYPFSPMLGSKESSENSADIRKQLSLCIDQVSKGRSLVHRDCL